MREILFRGKRVDNSEWIEGFYINVVKVNSFIATGKLTIDSINKNALIPEMYHVIPETVGQYTGATDKNGKKIFEGDILHCVSRLDNAKMVVIFECGEYRMVLAEKFNDYIEGCGFFAITCFEKEVVGNIHDNPELLKKERELNA